MLNYSFRFPDFFCAVFMQLFLSMKDNKILLEKLRNANGDASAVVCNNANGDDKKFSPEIYPSSETCGKASEEAVSLSNCLQAGNFFKISIVHLNTKTCYGTIVISDYLDIPLELNGKRFLLLSSIECSIKLIANHQNLTLPYMKYQECCIKIHFLSKEY